MAEILSISLSATLLEDGNYFIYYDGDSLNLPCGIYYLAIQIGDDIWYSDLFRVQDVSDSLIPEIKYKEFHTALPIYDSLYKQSDYNCDVILLNPQTQITPFFTKLITSLGSGVTVYLVNINTGVEVNITTELELVIDIANNYVYSAGGNFENNLPCGYFYLRFVTISGNWYSDVFKVVGGDTSNMDAYLITEDGQVLVTEDGEIILI